ncbi:MAG TPA: hypothetical protein VK506_05700 [Conexibacter sp.]|nr:hypothetical protein [Conexibacter sp.]
MSRTVYRVIMPVLVSMLMLGVFATSAYAESKVGRNLGRELTSVAQGLVFAVLVITSVPMFMNKLWTQFFCLTAAALPIGGFAFAPDAMIAIIRDFAGAIAP